MKQNIVENTPSEANLVKQFEPIQLPMDRLTKIYLRIRTAMSEKTKQYEKEFAELEEQRKVVANSMKDQMQAAGLKSVRTEFGTAILTQKTRYWTQDWDEFKKFVVKHDALDLFEKRIAQSNMSKFLEEHPDVVPPGLNADAELTVSVRKPQ
jgi:hypothetical protein